MREIKFRAWDKIKEEMIYSGIEHELRCIAEPQHRTDAGEDIIGFNEIDFMRFDFMQYTGLKDKNDKEIYEGDRIQYNENGNTTEVYYDPYSASYVPNFREWRKEYITVIGNIYEDKK